LAQVHLLVPVDNGGHVVLKLDSSIEIYCVLVTAEQHVDLRIARAPSRT
jgi:hypothetical protein